MRRRSGVSNVYVTAMRTGNFHLVEGTSRPLVQCYVRISAASLSLGETIRGNFRKRFPMKVAGPFHARWLGNGSFLWHSTGVAMDYTLPYVLPAEAFRLITCTQERSSHS